MSTETSALNKRDWIAGLEKGLQLIEAFDDAHARMTASQAAERCGLTRTAARRYLLTLTHLGYMASDGKLFWLTPRMLRLGQAYIESARLPRIVQPFLQRVTAGTQEIAYVSVLDDKEIVYIARSGSSRNMNTGVVLGARVQAQATSARMVSTPSSSSRRIARHSLPAPSTGRRNETRFLTISPQPTPRWILTK